MIGLVLNGFCSRSVIGSIYSFFFFLFYFVFCLLFCLFVSCFFFLQVRLFYLYFLGPVFVSLVVKMCIFIVIYILLTII